MSEAETGATGAHPGGAGQSALTASVRPRRGGRTPLVLALLTFLLLAWIILASSLQLNEGHWVYALDDAYIHMAMAKNFAQHGVWGVTRYEFTNSSSSPMWTALLALGFRILGPAETLPLVLNLIVALLLIYTAHQILKSYTNSLPGWAHLGLLLGVTLLAPIHALVFTGQEHTLHLLVTLLFAHLAARRVAIPSGQRAVAEGRAFWGLLPALALVRYESLFLVVAAAILLAVRRRWREALLVCAVASIPVVVLGLLGLGQGWWLLPNSLLLKANLPYGDWLRALKMISGYVVLQRLVAHTHLLVLVASALLLLARRGPGVPTSATRPLIFIFLIATVLHLLLADVGWFYRYEAYLVSLGILAVGAAAAELWRSARGQRLADWRPLPRGVALGGLLLLAIAAPLDGAGRAAIEIPRATANIYDQQYQMGQFLGAHYPGAGVALNDIGVACFLGDIHCVDLAGLASIEAARQIRSGGGELETREALLHERGVEIAIVYPTWFRIPPTWIPCGSWSMRDNIVNGGVTVTFYALQEDAAAALLTRLREFAPRLPQSVIQHGPYCRREPRGS